MLVRFKDGRASVCCQQLALLISDEWVAPAGNDEARDLVLLELRLVFLMRLGKAGPGEHRERVHASESIHPALVDVVLNGLHEDGLPRVALRNLPHGLRQGQQLLDALLFARLWGHCCGNRLQLLDHLALEMAIRRHDFVRAGADDSAVEALFQPAHHNLCYGAPSAETDDARPCHTVCIHDCRDIIGHVIPIVWRIEVAIHVHASICGEQGANRLHQALVCGNECLALLESFRAAHIARVVVDDKESTLSKALNNWVHAIHRCSSADDGDDARVFWVAIGTHVKLQAVTVLHERACCCHLHNGLSQGQGMKMVRFPGNACTKA
mmetsp:Transcript_19504/g.45591  ORF Transcript_19504/g.45591 Transcript_19504/m.45591 type:complete len:324 (-) Transcript_19504:7-978(-)